VALCASPVGAIVAPVEHHGAHRERSVELFW